MDTGCKLCGGDLPAHRPDCAEGAPTADLIDPGAQITPRAAVEIPRIPIAGRYQCIDLLGRGGFGAVFKAHDTRLGRAVAVKLIHRDSAGAEERERFSREALILARLDHPAVIPVYDAGHDGDRPYLVMKLVTRGSLAARIRTEGWPETEALRAAAEIAGALAHAHEREVLHRDLKPSNVLIDEGERLYLADFGISAAGFLPRVTVQGDMMGTLSYMAPETLQGRIGPAADLYALGVILHELLFGVPCFSADTPAELINQVLICDPPRLRDLDGRLTPAAAGLLARLLAKQPEQRPASAAALEDELRGLTRGAASGTILPGGTGAPAPEAPRREIGALLEQLERVVEEIRGECARAAPSLDRLLQQLAAVGDRGGALLERMAGPPAAGEDDSLQYAHALTLARLVDEAARNAGELLARPGFESLTGYLLRLNRALAAPAAELHERIAGRRRAGAPAADEFLFETPAAQSAPDDTPGAEWERKLASLDAFERHEALQRLAGPATSECLEHLRRLAPARRDELLALAWDACDVLLIEGRGRTWPLLESAIALAGDPALAARYRLVHALFNRPGGAAHWTAAAVSAALDPLPAAQRAMLARCLLLHPDEALRRLGFESATPPDFWEVISHPATPPAWLLALWRHLRPRVGVDYLKVFLACARDRLSGLADLRAVEAGIELAKELYEIPEFHEDIYFRMLAEIDEALRAAGRRHGLLVDFDREYIERFRAFFATGVLKSQPLGVWSAVPLPIQRRLARAGHFLRHFASHPRDPIALECLPHIAQPDLVRGYLDLKTINARLIAELARDKRLFLTEDARFALVANPRTPAHAAAMYIGMLRRDSLKKLAESRELNTFSHTHALKLLGRSV